MTVTPGGEVVFNELPGRRSADPLGAVLAAESSLRISRPQRTSSRKAHRHPLSEEVIYVRAGTGAVYIDGALLAVAPGDTVHVPRGAAHATIPDEATGMELICFFPHPDLSQNIEATDIDVMKETSSE